MQLTPYRFPSPLIVIVSTLFWTSLTSIASATPLASTVLEREMISSGDHQLPLERNRQLAQLFYPKPSENQTIQVIGIGEASQSADRAAFTIRFTPKGDSPSSLEGMGVPISMADLEPFVDALKAEGIAVSETQIAQSNPQMLPFPLPGNSDSDGTAIMVSLENPQPEDLDNVIEIIRTVEKQSDRLSLKTAEVQFELDNCTGLEQETYQAAVKDAQNRAQAIADSIGATLDIPAVSEPFYSLALPGCSIKTFSFLNEPQTYEPGMATELQITRQLFFTYPITKALQ
ncbi:MAG: DUF541 domain-containing protein [Cyanobacteria bacterium]|jgi:hypothetical protein|nr:DUF541 domain-containing protein [Cyanobacteria bacterium GSL.Bin1]